jgi:serine/threonine protein kinase
MVEQGLAAVHSYESGGYIHADLEPRNILLDLPADGSMPRAALADFGLALPLVRAEGVRLSMRHACVQRPLERTYGLTFTIVDRLWT